MSPSAQGLAQHLNTLGSLLLFSDQCQGDFHGLWLSFLSLLSPWEGVILLSRELGHSAAGRRERGVREEPGLGQLEPLCKESALGFPQIADLACHSWRAYGPGTGVPLREGVQVSPKSSCRL